MASVASSCQNGTARAQSSSTAEEKKPSPRHLCQWSNCSNRGPFARAEELSRHLETEHFPAFDAEDFVLCLWEGCKVFNQPCNKKTWLANHIKIHTKERPHKCLLNGCNFSFCTVEALQNHLQLHFQSKACPKGLKSTRGRKRGWRLHGSHQHTTPLIHADSDGSSPPPKKSAGVPGEGEEEDEYCLSDYRKLEKKRMSLRVRIPLHSNSRLSSPSSADPQPVPVNGAHIHSDLIDRRTMAVVRDTVAQLARYSPSCDGICLSAEIIGKRVPVATAVEEYLVRWSPRLITDTWVPADDFQHQKILYLSELTPLQKSSITAMFFHTDQNRTRNLRKRKCVN